MMREAIESPPKRLAPRRRLQLYDAEGGRRAFYLMAVQHGCFAAAPLACTLYLLVLARGHVMAFDFHYQYWAAGHAVLHGLPLYAPTPQDLADHRAFPYPAGAAVLFAPFALLGRGAGDVVMTLVSLVAPLLALRVLAVRDWRLYGLALLWPPVMAGWENANLTAVLVLGAAGLWRCRDQRWAAAVLLAALITVKPLVWPLALFFLGTRRTGVLVRALVAGAAMNLAVWALVGFSELSRFADVLQDVTRIERYRGYSIAAFGVRHGLAETPATALAVAVALAAAVGCLVAGRRGDEPRALCLGVATMLLASPILWTHYLTFLLVPLAVIRPRLGVLWLLPLLTLPCPITPPSPAQHLVVLGVLAAVVLGLTAGRVAPEARAARTRPSPSPSPSPG
jgi:hypothetical protein